MSTTATFVLCMIIGSILAVILFTNNRSLFLGKSRDTVQGIFGFVSALLAIASVILIDESEWWNILFVLSISCMIACLLIGLYVHNIPVDEPSQSPESPPVQAKQEPPKPDLADLDKRIDEIIKENKK